MAYIEMGDTLFRGTLAGASGTFNLDVLADAADVASTINIKNGSVTVQYATFIPSSHYCTANQIITSLTVNVPDTTAFLEVFGADQLAGGLYLNNVLVPAKAGQSPSSQLSCVRGLYKVSSGLHLLSLVASALGYSNWSFIVARYIRSTGSDNA